ncbi:MAG: N-acetylmuramic acid 6-phosphate etherase [Acidobacteria bacterium]|nr:N-acetylmuramic acid 6-phosphate etherase [Acidobacteriota bacterium]MBI3658697.1 N-acetylmuramic acid 6-phosphate etherase [Acidobacteriota bacterium]
MKLITEELNPVSQDIDTKSSQEILSIINDEDQTVPRAVRQEIAALARAVDILTDALSQGGRMFYIGAGTSGRLGVLDAVECPPTFNTDPHLVQGVMAGGYRACGNAVEAKEDDPRRGAIDLKARRITKSDIIIGIAASGRTPYTIGALKYARQVGARTIAVTCNPDSEMAQMVDVPIAVVVGPEVVAGSTRMKAGTAQKLVLNMLTTATMIRLGKVYSHWMVNVHLKNEKLLARGRRILMAALNVDAAKAAKAIRMAGQDLSVAFVMLKTSATRRQAQKLLQQNNGHVRHAVAMGLGERA